MLSFDLGPGTEPVGRGAGLGVPAGWYFPADPNTDTGAGGVLDGDAPTAVDWCGRAAGVFPRLPGWCVVFAHRDPVVDAVVVGGERLDYRGFAVRVAAAVAAYDGLGACEGCGGEGAARSGVMPVVLMVCGAAAVDDAVDDAVDGDVASAVVSVLGRGVVAADGRVWQTSRGAVVEGGGWWFYPGPGLPRVWVGTDLAVAVAAVTPGPVWPVVGWPPVGRAVSWIELTSSKDFAPTVAQYWSGWRPREKDPADGELREKSVARGKSVDGGGLLDVVAGE